MTPEDVRFIGMSIYNGFAQLGASIFFGCAMIAVAILWGKK